MRWSDETSSSGDIAGPEPAAVDSTQRFTAISAGGSFTCALRTDGVTVCWGNELAGPIAPPPEERLVSISAGGGSACGLRADGSIFCWTDDREVHPLAVSEVPPDGPFTSITTSDSHACALRPDGEAVCWGGTDWGEASPPPGERFTAIDSNWRQTCGLRHDGAAVCWGYRGYPLATPSGRFTAIGVGFDYACGLMDDGEVRCWTRDWYSSADEVVSPIPNFIPPPAGPFTSISVGYGHACALRADGEAACWGYRTEVKPPSRGLSNHRSVTFPEKGQSTPPPGERFTSVSVGPLHTCGLREDGSAVCWGSDDHLQSSPPPDFRSPPAPRFTAVSTERLNICAVREEDGAVVCWLFDWETYTHTRRVVPPGPGDRIVEVSVYHDAVCALAESNRLICGHFDEPGTSEPSEPFPDDRFLAVSAGPHQNCGIREDGSLLCWDRAGERVAVPDGAFTSIDQRDDLACGARDGAATICWRPEWAQQGSEVYVTRILGRTGSLSLGNNGICALRLDHTAFCQGTGGPASPADEVFVSISLGYGDACGLREDGVAICWVRDDDEAHTLEGRYRSISADLDRIWGVRDDGRLLCWGPVWPCHPPHAWQD